MADGALLSGEDGEFTIDLRTYQLTAGPVALSIRAGRYDVEQGRTVYGEWSPFCFTFAPPAPPQTAQNFSAPDGVTNFDNDIALLQQELDRLARQFAEVWRGFGILFAEGMVGLFADNYADFEYYTDAFAGGYDGFFDTINPFDGIVSLPDVGVLNGNDGAYTVGGSVAAIGVNLAISTFGPGLVQCGSLGAKALAAWEIADAAGAIASAGKNLMNGSFSGLDALNLAGGLVSLGALKGMNCFTGDVGVTCLVPFVGVAAMSSSDKNSTNDGYWLLFVGIGLFFAWREIANQKQA